MTTDTGKISLCILLHLSAAFDTLVHKMLLMHLADVAEVDGPALQLLQSFVSSRIQRVVVGNSSSSSLKALTCRVPQGSILSPLLFNIHEATGAENEMLWSQLPTGWALNYVSFSTDATTATATMSECIQEISSLAQKSWLRMYPGKTQMMLVVKRNAFKR